MAAMQHVSLQASGNQESRPSEVAANFTTAEEVCLFSSRSEGLESAVNA